MSCQGNTCSVGGTIAASTPAVSSRQLISFILNAILQAMPACVAAISQIAETRAKKRRLLLSAKEHSDGFMSCGRGQIGGSTGGC